MKKCRIGRKRWFGGPFRGRIGLIALPAFISIYLPSQLSAQTASSDSQGDAQEARIDAILATPNLVTPVPQTNLFATAPGLEQQAPSPRFTLNFLAPFLYNSNAEKASSDGTRTLEMSPVGNLSFATPLFDLPVRLLANVRAETDRFVESNNADLDKLGGSLRARYVDPNNDQSFSPYFAYAPRMAFAPTFSREVETRNDLNLGFNKIFNFDGSFQVVPFASNTGASTVWSFGLTAFGQRRFREPTSSSYALFVIPSVSYAISGQWNASLAVEVIGHWFDSNAAGLFRRDWDVIPIATVEYVIPALLFGAPETAALFGRPALDFQTSLERVTSNFSGSRFSQWTAGVAIKTGWRF